MKLARPISTKGGLKSARPDFTHASFRLIAGATIRLRLGWLKSSCPARLKPMVIIPSLSLPKSKSRLSFLFLSFSSEAWITSCPKWTGITPQRPTRATDPQRPTRATDPQRPTRATNPQRPTRATDPQRPTRATNPQRPTRATDPQRPTRATNPQRPTRATNPQRPTRVSMGLQ
ncbi:MAG: DUF4573 domain-containing protein [Roseibium sp.]|nr:DUF4573 domain-containing protein [Roseibium sp.]